MTTKANIEAVNSGQTEREALLADYIELNMSNYGPDDVDRLNAWAIEAYDFIARAASTATATGDREIWEYSFIHSSALGRPDEKVTLLTYDKDTAFKSTCFDQKLVCSAGVAIAEVCQDADGFKHIAEIVEELDDIPAGTRLYAYSVAAASPAPASPSGEDAAEQAAAPMADDVEDDDIQPTPESERAAFNAMMRWHLIRLLQAWRYGGDLRAAGMAAFEWARSNDVGKAAFEASDRAVKLSADLPRASEQADEAVTDADSLYFALVGAESQLRQISKLLDQGHEFIDKGRTVEIWADMANKSIDAYLAKEPK